MTNVKVVIDKDKLSKEELKIMENAAVVNIVKREIQGVTNIPITINGKRSFLIVKKS